MVIEQNVFFYRLLWSCSLCFEDLDERWDAFLIVFTCLVAIIMSFLFTREGLSLFVHLLWGCRLNTDRLLQSAVSSTGLGPRMNENNMRKIVSWLKWVPPKKGQWVSGWNYWTLILRLLLSLVTYQTQEVCSMCFCALFTLRTYMWNNPHMLPRWLNSLSATLRLC